MEMRAEIEPYIKDNDCSVVGTVVTAVWTLDKAGFNRFWVEKGAPEMRSRFELCGDDFMPALQKILPAGRELEPLVAARQPSWGTRTASRTARSSCWIPGRTCRDDAARDVALEATFPQDRVNGATVNPWSICLACSGAELNR